MKSAAMPPMTAKKPPQRGVSLLEVLVSLVILSFGMLGLAGLQTRLLAFGQSSLYRSQATILTDDLLDRMRIDRARATASAGNVWVSALDEVSANIPIATRADLKDWKREVESALPDGKASIAVDTTGDQPTVTVVVEWDDTRGREAVQQFQTQTRL